MDELKQGLADNLLALAKGVANNRVYAVFTVAVTDDGPTQAVLVEPEYRESLVIAINEEVTRMLGKPHHIISTGKLEKFLTLHNITEQDLLQFQDSDQD